MHSVSRASLNKQTPCVHQRRHGAVMHRHGMPSHSTPPPMVEGCVGSIRPTLTLKQARSQGKAKSAGHVQVFFGSRNSAGLNAYHTSLRPSSSVEPRHPLLKVVTEHSPYGSHRQKRIKTTIQRASRNKAQQRKATLHRQLTLLPIPFHFYVPMIPIVFAALEQCCSACEAQCKPALAILLRKLRINNT